MIYFAQSTDGGPVKIGCSTNVDHRIQCLEFHYGCRLVLLATLPGGREEEKEIHERFSHLRLGRTEQFRSAPDLMEFIGLPMFSGDNFETMEAMKPSFMKGFKPVRLYINQGTHHLLRQVAAKANLSMSEWVHLHVTLTVTKEANRLGIK